MREIKAMTNIKILPAFAQGKRLPRGNGMVMCGAGKASELKQEFAKLLAALKGCAAQ